MRPASDVLRPPAIALLVVAALNFLFGGLSLLSYAVNRPDGRSLSGVVTFQLLALLGVLAAPVIAAGGIQMLQVRSYPLVRVAAFLAMIPGLSCCFVLGIPAGIWTLAALNRPGVIESFDADA